MFSFHIKDWTHWQGREFGMTMPIFEGIDQSEKDPVLRQAIISQKQSFKAANRTTEQLSYRGRQSNTFIVKSGKRD